MSARGHNGAPFHGDHTGIDEVEFAADPAEAMQHFLRQDDEFYAAMARAGGAMLGTSSTGKLHVFEPGRLLSRCGTLFRQSATVSDHRTDVEAIEAGADMCRICCADLDQIRDALADQGAP